MKALMTMMPIFDLQTHHSKVEVPWEFDLRDLAKKYSVFPLKVISMNGTRRLLLAMKNPYNHNATRDVEFRAGMPIIAVQADDKDIRWLIQTHYYGQKLSPIPSGYEDVTHDVFAQFEIVSKIQEAPDRRPEPEIQSAKEKA
jgi:hypothetical protein